MVDIFVNDIVRVSTDKTFHGSGVVGSDGEKPHSPHDADQGHARPSANPAPRRSGRYIITAVHRTEKRC